MINDRYKLGKLIGQGGFGSVYCATDTKLSKPVAIKCIDIQHKHLPESVNRQKIRHEIDLMSNLSHPNIVKYYDSVETPTHWYIIMEYCNNGTLADIINNLPIISEREDFARYYLVQLRSALQYLRQHDYAHRDLKPTNILLTKEREVVMETDTIFSLDEDYGKVNKIYVKLADFGLSKTDTHLMKTVCGSPMFMAPEVLLEETYDNSADLWSFGVIMYQMLMGKYPRDAQTLAQLKNEALDPINLHYEYGFSDLCYDLLGKLLSVKSKRLSWDDLFKHEWFEQPVIDFTSQIGQIKPVSKLSKSNLSKMKGLDTLSDSFEFL